MFQTILFTLLCYCTGTCNHNRIGFEEMDSFNNASRDEDKILDQIYIKQICSDFYYDDFQFSLHYTKLYFNIGLALKPNFMSSLLQNVVFL